MFGHVIVGRYHREAFIAFWTEHDALPPATQALFHERIREAFGHSFYEAWLAFPSLA